MFEQLGIAVMASIAAVAPQPSSIRLDLVAVVPVTCSSAVMIAAQPTQNGVVINLGGSCNASHMVRVTVPPAIASQSSASLNGVAGQKEAQSFVFTRPGYFNGSSLLNINVADSSTDMSIEPTSLLFEISPL